MQPIHTSRRSKAQNTSRKLFEGVSKYEKNTNINSDGKLDLAKGKNINLFKYQVQKYCFFSARAAALCHVTRVHVQ